MRTLIFGGAGMLGRATVSAARARGWAALGLSREQVDATDAAAVQDAVARFAPDLIVNAAAFTAVDLCEEREEEAKRVNEEAVGVLTTVARARALRLVQVSTDYVFDGQGDVPYPEDAPTAPASAYGRTKLAGERRALEWERSLVVRTSWLFGPGGPNFVATMVRLIEAGRVPLRVVADQFGAPTYTGFLAGAICDLAAAGATGIVHYRNRGATSWHGFASAIADLWAGDVDVLPVTTADFPRPAPRPAYSVLAVDRAEAILGRRVEPWMAGLAPYLETLRGGGFPPA